MISSANAISDARKDGRQVAKKPDPKADAKAIRKLGKTKAVNRVERENRRDAGNDSKHTRDGGTNRRNWR